MQGYKSQYDKLLDAVRNGELDGKIVPHTLTYIQRYNLCQRGGCEIVKVRKQEYFKKIR